MERSISVNELRKMCRDAQQRFDNPKDPKRPAGTAQRQRVTNLLTFTEGMTSNTKVTLSHDDLVALLH